MIYHFSNISKKFNIGDDENYNYRPIVGDSFTGDTPLFIKYDNTGLIDIKPISELIGNTETDTLGREYDTSEKPFKVLCRSGWMKPSYIHRHNTEKPLYEISEGNMSITVTEDHSLFNDKQEKIKPSEINEGTKLEYYNGKIPHSHCEISEKQVVMIAKMLKNDTIDRVPVDILNLKNKSLIKKFINEIEGINYNKLTKTCLAGIQFIKANGTI